VIAQGLVAEISGATLWRWLSSDALRPWQHRSWVFPRDPNFAAKAGPVLDLYHRVWEGAPLGADDFVISADEKTSIQPRRRKQPTLPPAPNRPTRVEHEYFREGAWVYLAAWDVHRAKVFGRCEMQNGIAPVDRLVAEVMSQEPYKSARRVFWIMDNCSAHRGQRAADRFRAQWPNAILIHTPNHASWLNQVEISRFEARALRLSAPHATANQPAVSRRRQQKSSSASGQSFHIATNERYPTRWQLFSGW
jgi:hypothetical protein